MRRRPFSPPQLLSLHIAGLILTGGVLLSLPISAGAGRTVSFLNALFTSTSAVCVTGLIVIGFQGVRMTPNVYATLEEVDTFAAAMEDLAKNGLPKTPS